MPCAMLLLQPPTILFVSRLAQQLSNGRTHNSSVGKTHVASAKQAARDHVKQCFSAFCMLLIALVSHAEALMSNLHSPERRLLGHNLQQEKRGQVHPWAAAVRWETRKHVFAE